MQARKRAKPVKFGKQAEQKPEKIKAAEPEEVKEKPEEEKEAPEEKSLSEASVLSDKPLVEEEEEEKEEEEKEDKKEESLSATPPPAVSEKPKEFETFGIASSDSSEASDSKEKEPDSVLSATIPDTSSTLSSQPSSVASGESLPLNSAFSTTPDVPSEKKKGNFLYFIIVAVVSFVVGLGAMAGFEYATQNKMLNVKLPQMPALGQFGLGPKATPTPKPAEPTEAPKEVDLSAHTVRVLNGSGIQGEASRLKEKLTTAGFKVGSVGNADRDDYTKTQVAVKKSVDKAFVEKLKEVLGESYEVDKESELPAAASDEADVTVTIGSETAN